jgi:hypothetical protein
VEVQPKPAEKADPAAIADDKRVAVNRPVVVNSHAYEAFLSKKEDKPKTTSSSSSNAAAAAFEPAGVRPRKPCNCTKSQCLKL